MGFSRREYWSGLSCPPLGDLPNQGFPTVSLKSHLLHLEAGFLRVPLGKPHFLYFNKIVFIKVILMIEISGTMANKGNTFL